MHKFTLSLASLLAIAGATIATADYDQSWHRAPYWPGEYPMGFAVIKKGVTVPARAVMDRKARATIRCGLPFRANIHPWNAKHPGRYVSVTKIVPMVAKEDVKIGYPEDGEATVRKGETIEYLVYGSEGFFTVRYQGKEYGASQELLEKVSYDKTLMDTPVDQWVELTCQGGKKAWVLLGDLVKTKNDKTSYYPGIGNWYRGFRDYGKVEDLTDADLRKED